MTVKECETTGSCHARMMTTTMTTELLLGDFQTGLTYVQEIIRVYDVSTLSDDRRFYKSNDNIFSDRLWTNF